MKLIRASRAVFGWWMVAGCLWAGDLQSSRNLLHAGDESGLLAYWRLNDGAGTAATDLTPGDLIDTAGSIRVGMAPPKLFILHDPGEVVAFRDKDARGFVLEAALELQPGAGWISIRGPCTINGGFHEVRIPDANLSETSFFRLVRP